MTYLSIEAARRKKWELGRAKYGPVFQGHPLEQFDDEMIDAMNYIEEAERQGVISSGFAAQMHLDLRELCERVRWAMSHSRDSAPVEKAQQVTAA